MKLYDAYASGNVQKFCVLPDLLEQDYEMILINLPNEEQTAPSYLAMNPLGQVPVPDDNDLILRDSQAVLVYLARKYGNEEWLPTFAARELVSAEAARKY